MATSPTTTADEDSLSRAINSTPIIDHHAHPLLKPAAFHKHPLLSVTTEAHGDALSSSRTSLAHFRAVKQLSSILGCEPTWEAVSRAIDGKRTGNHHEWVSRCLSGIECVLVDDGLDSEYDAEPYSRFDDFTPSASKRIVRIEALAARLIQEACKPHASSRVAFDSFTRAFNSAIARCIWDGNVVAFKSVICYRTGLAIPRQKDAEAAFSAFENVFFQLQKYAPSRPFSVNHPGLNEYLVHLLADMIRIEPHPKKKPIQFHVGLGDNDITLTKSSPSHLQEFIREHPEVPIVLLHSGYPFVREAGYLATVYANVYVDTGEVFPTVSRDGQETMLRQILELCPGSKILWSTDGHWFPETYLLAVIQVREALHAVLLDYIRKGDLTLKQAIRLVEDMLFQNSNELYGLSLNLTMMEPTTTTPQQEQARTANKNAEILSQFLEGKDAPRFLGVWWNDMTAAPRMRSIPVRHIWSMLRSGQELSFGLATAYHQGLLLNETAAAGVTASGEWRLHPDLTTLRLGPRKGHIVAMANLCEKDGSAVSICPRSLLRRTLEAASRQGLTLDLGFEMELVFARRGASGYEVVGAAGHNASSVRAMEHEVMGVIEDAIEQLEAGGMYVEMVHAESGPGQFEIILPKAPALEAVDALLYARDIVSGCAAAKGYRMTLHPKPTANACGTASHVHMSISSPGGSEPEVYEPFYAGILKHLRAINAFTYSNIASYQRVQDSCWAGGTWVTWGSQNRETPLRKIEGTHWEMKCMDGLANPYLALSAVILAGVDGVGKKEEMVWRDCVRDPATLSDAERTRIGMVTRMPRSLPEALEALEALEEDRVLCDLLGQSLLERYTTVKKTETEFLKAMDEDARRTWIMDRF